MTESKEPGDRKREPHTAPRTMTEPNNPLLWVRESIAGIISLVILSISALMLYGTYNYVKDTPVNADAAVITAHKESYERQKDIMLYALALLGTVTGYYLGRVPAELHAQQAQRAARSAQDQLQKTQSKLTDTAGSAAAAAAQVTVAEKEKDAAKTKLNKATKSLEGAKHAISKALSLPPSPRVLGASAGSESLKDIEDLRHVEQEIENTLREIRDYKE